MMEKELLDKIKLHLPDLDYGHLKHLFDVTFKRLHDTKQKYQSYPLHYTLHIQTILYPLVHSIVTMDWSLSHETLCARLTAIAVFVNSELDKIGA